MDIPATEDRCLNCHAPVSGKTLQEDVREKGELDSLKFELRNVELLLEILVGDYRYSSDNGACQIDGNPVGLLVFEGLNDAFAVSQFAGPLSSGTSFTVYDASAVR